MRRFSDRNGSNTPMSMTLLICAAILIVASSSIYFRDDDHNSDIDVRLIQVREMGRTIMSSIMQNSSSVHSDGSLANISKVIVWNGSAANSYGTPTLLDELILNVIQFTPDGSWSIIAILPDQGEQILIDVQVVIWEKALFGESNIRIILPVGRSPLPSWRLEI